MTVRQTKYMTQVSNFNVEDTLQNDTLQVDTLRHQIWQQLQRASVDKHHEWRSPVLVTNGIDNDQVSAPNIWPDARTVILRAVDLNSNTLTFYTDSRSPKVSQLLSHPNALLVFWSKRLNWQLRVKVNISVVTHGELHQKTWIIVKQSASAKDYLSLTAPGELLTDNVKKSEPQQVVPHFAILIAQVINIDWLALSRSGHQRANINSNSFNFIVP